MDWRPVGLHAGVLSALNHADECFKSTGRDHKIVKRDEHSFLVVDSAAWEQHKADLDALLPVRQVPPSANESPEQKENERLVPGIATGEPLPPGLRAVYEGILEIIEAKRHRVKDVPIEDGNDGTSGREEEEDA